MAEFAALIAAAGTGSRSGLPYPKTLYPVQGRPILLRICDLLAPYDIAPTVIVSPAGRAEIAATLAHAAVDAHLVEQAVPRGMGDAVLQFRRSPAWTRAEHVILIWGDIPLIQSATLAAVVEAHRADDNDMTFATRHVDSAYTIVSRDAAGRVTGLRETRETGTPTLSAGERDVGIFVFRCAPVFDLLDAPLPDRVGATTGEHGFLYVVEHLAARGGKVVALPVATELDLISLNRLDDLKGFV